MRIHLVALGLVLCGTVAAAQPASGEPNIWGGLGGGGYTGEDYEPDPAESDPDHNDVGGYALHGTFNVSGEHVGLRIRQTWLFEYTSNRADETALEVALPVAMNKKLWVAAGVSRLTDVSNEKKSPTVGVPVELMLYPVRGLELMVHANFNKDSNFVGVAVSGAIGRRRPRD